MRTVKTNELTGAALDWAVAKCEGKADDCEIHAGNVWYGRATTGFTLYSPTKNWAQGGSIIEREKISIECKHDGWWVASYQYNYSDHKEYVQLSETPLIAAMRCFIASKLGDEVQIPEELTNG